MKKIFPFFFIFLSSFLMSQKQDRKNLIKGKWDFKVFDDTIAFPILPEINIKTSNKIFLNSIEFEDNTFSAKNKLDKFEGKWVILGNNLILYFSNKVSLLYEIMRLNNDRLELKEEGMLVPNLGYQRRN
ncbi:lipocalin-like domain-containing protein [Chryseobacterium takakiae]|uniref:Lipocalin-like domain-containing protein n=1 Tax=Chryseobacterium takakiae TaxID=1302685 RepID=A0A1M5B7S1_9FLAO|nr:lipocalin family protein [Chryseobacterium takakiae]SHF38498.1 Lipocalin-like domain-containing protein [Chryseobacterium takakiae]